MNRGLKIISEIAGVGVILLIMWATVQSFSSQSPMPVGIDMDIESIVTQVNQYCAGGQINSKGTCNSLLQKLQGAIEARDRGQPEVACNKLNAFSNEVQAQSGKKIDPAAAQVLVDMVTPLCAPVPTATATEIVVSPLPTPTPNKQQLLTVFLTLSDEETKRDELYKVILDYQGQLITNAQKIEFPLEPLFRVKNLHVSPNGQNIILEWIHPNSMSYLTTLNPNTLESVQLLTHKTDDEAGASFIAWHPNNRDIFVEGYSTPFSADRIWVINVNTHDYNDKINIRKDLARSNVTNIAFSPDGQTVVYGWKECGSCYTSQIWRINLDNTQEQLLFKDKTQAFQVNDLTWSTDGNTISFAHSHGVPQDGTIGDLYLMPANGGQVKKLSSVVVDIYSRFKPQWLSNSQAFFFVKEDEQKYRNLYKVKVNSGQVQQVTHFASNNLFRLTWLNQATQLGFFVEMNGQYYLTLIEPTGQIIKQLPLDPIIQKIKAEQLSALTHSQINLRSLLILPY